METSLEVKERIKRLNARLARYIPPRDTWTPAEEALFKPTDLYRVPLNEAQAMQLKALKYAFRRHFTLNHFYRRYCDMRGVRLDDIKTYGDLEKIPLLPDLTFKQHPSGEDFAHWIANIYTGELPTVVIETANPTFDDVINAFNAAGMVVGYSSGTSGRHTVMPRDARTYCTAQCTDPKLKSALTNFTADHFLLLFPNPKKTNLWIGKVQRNKLDVFDDVHSALDFKISADLTLKAMTDTEQPGGPHPSAEERQRRIIDVAIKWLERYDKTTDTIGMDGPPALIVMLMDALEREEKRFEFGERGLLLTGGGWKISEDKRIPYAGFRKRVAEVLGIPETRCLDTYAMIENNAPTTTCPEGHYYHIPYTWMKPLVLDKSMEPAGYGETGRYAFLDGLAGSYPGFVITGDEVRMYEHCPVCDRPGPVLDHEVKRAPSVEMRGCAEEVRRILQQDFGE